MLALPRSVRKEIRIGPAWLEPPQELEIGKTPPQIIFNNPISSINTESAPDLFFFYFKLRKFYIVSEHNFGY